MSRSNQLSLWAAVIINLNIIIGSGVFINTTELAKRAGACGALSYAVVGLLLFPLILSFARLLHLYPGGGFYSFASTSLSPIVGFFSTWCYFTTKISSATLAIHIFVLLLQKMVPALSTFNPLMLDIIVLSALVGLNMLNIKTGSTIQKYLMILKLFPIFLVIGTALFLLNWTNLSTVHQVWEGIPSTIPLVLHAMLGFETACSISRNIQNPEKNAPRAVLLSYGLVILLYVTYQTLVYALLGNDLTTQTDYRGLFPLVVSKLAISDALRNFLGHFIHLSIALSALSAGFGMIYANIWNLYSLAELGYTCAPQWILQLNRYSVPFVCVIVEGIISALYMVIINGEQVTFQQLSGFGATITYSLSILGLLAVMLRTKERITVPVLGLLNCGILLFASLYTMWSYNNPKPVLIFVGLMTIGIVMYWQSNKTHSPA